MARKFSTDACLVAAAVAAFAVTQGCRTTGSGAASKPAEPATVAQPVAPVAPVAPVTTPAQEPILLKEPVTKDEPVVAPKEQAKVYTVKKGDTLSGIAASHGVKLNDLMAANPGVKAKKLAVGQDVKIPSSSGLVAGVAEKPVKALPPKKKHVVRKPAKADAEGNYVVKAGDTLGGIAHANGITTSALREANNLTGDKLSIGQKLVVKAKSATTVEPAVAPEGAVPEAAPATAPVSPAPAAPVTGTADVTPLPNLDAAPAPVKTP